ncbi:MAG: hypothetical protein DCC43_10700 [Candidatus Brocadia sp.]|jgi:ribonuclease HII|nr:hypothetical protein [Candidatus Brocadia fulgida]MCC6325555.1 hypothetical protein [Candidatus Brocadia sp.]MCE7912427.1 hypothetical protein [Candidatus Brocadia sp. AMX3]OQY98506.1 MAG: hypothetical protein B6D35_11900 [Candidatus Brocadia sp. UTAMX2]MDG5997924.1 hypothetical protein [Candidatus Brocadia sp.]
MAIIAGIDEAGYGPVLGPMVTTIVAFHVPDEKIDHSLWDLLKDAVSSDLKGGNQRIAVRDSKKLYRPQHGPGLKPLEVGALSFLESKGLNITSFCQLLDSLSYHAAGGLSLYPWYAGKDYPLPLTTNRIVIVNSADALNQAFDKQGVRFFHASSCVVPVQEFNEQIRLFRNKSLVLFKACAGLVSRLWNLPGGHIRLMVDKQGGRNTYTSLLREQLSHADIRVVKEGDKISTYEVEAVQKKMTISFVEKGEDLCMAVALASMFSKYIRELFMRLENQYWTHLLPGLKPTAGYYSDAQRFLAEIAPVRESEKIQDDILIRMR